MWWFVNIYTWMFHGEERAAMEFDKMNMPLDEQLFWILVINVGVITIEVGFFSLLRLIPWSKIPWLQKAKNWEWFSWLRIWSQKLKSGKSGRLLHFFTRGKPIGLFTLSLMALTPACQKAGSLTLVTKCRHLGIKGFGALCVGGAIRVIVVVFLSADLVWAVIMAAIVIRLVIGLASLASNLFGRVTTSKKVKK